MVMLPLKALEEALFLSLLTSGIPKFSLARGHITPVSFFSHSCIPSVPAYVQLSLLL